MRLSRLLSAAARSGRWPRTQPRPAIASVGRDADCLLADRVWGALPRSVLREVAAAAWQITIPAGQGVVLPADGNIALLLVEEGHIEVGRNTAGGAWQPIATCGPGTLVGDLRLPG